MWCRRTKSRVQASIPSGFGCSSSRSPGLGVVADVPGEPGHLTREGRKADRGGSSDEVLTVGTCSSGLLGSLGVLQCCRMPVPLGTRDPVGLFTNSGYSLVMDCFPGC